MNLEFCAGGGHFEHCDFNAEYCNTVSIYIWVKSIKSVYAFFLDSVYSHTSMFAGDMFVR